MSGVHERRKAGLTCTREAGLCTCWACDAARPTDTRNLDAMTQAELHCAAKRYRTLALYAETRLNSMSLREIGRIDEAVALENRCDALYAELPQDWRW